MFLSQTGRLEVRHISLTRYALQWDAANLRFTNLDEANAFVRREYRQGWTL